MLQQTFMQKVLATLFAGFIAACFLWVFRHIVDQAFYESNEGWKDMYKNKNSTPGAQRR